MMQPTPAPSSAPNSPGPVNHALEDDPNTYTAPPVNMDSAPFSVLVGLFEKLQNERKQERRKKLVGAWFNVCFFHCYLCLWLSLSSCISIGERRKEMTYIRCCASSFLRRVLILTSQVP